MLAVSEQDVESAGLALDVGGVARSHTNGSAQSSVEQSGSDCGEPVRVNKTRKTTRRSRKQSLEMMQTFRVVRSQAQDVLFGASVRAFGVKVESQHLHARGYMEGKVPGGEDGNGSYSG